MKTCLILLASLLIFLLDACGPSQQTLPAPQGVEFTETPPATSPGPSIQLPTTLPATAVKTAQILLMPTPVIPTQTSEPTATMSPDEWKDLPVIPEVGPRAAEIYQRGLEMGNNPHAFSKIGDCGSTPAWFLGDFDWGEKFYRLGEHEYLEPVIQWYHGSFGRTSLAAKSGFNASSIFAPIWSDPVLCQPGEAPLNCEYRVNQPVIAFIMLGSNDVYHPAEFEPAMRKIIEFSIEKGVIPILSTKGDDMEGDGSINATIARLAREYGIPLLNYWAALQDLPEKGLQEDQVHLTWGPNRFDDPLVMTRAWPVRNLTALQVLDAVWRSATGQTPDS